MKDITYFNSHTLIPPQQKKERAGVVIATTALLWCTEAMPLMITALMPAILFPFAGVLDTKEISAVYWNVGQPNSNYNCIFII